MNLDKSQILQRRQFIRISNFLFQNGPREANEEYPSISVKEFEVANEYFNTLRCPGCFCGACLDLPKLGSNLDTCPEALQPIAAVARLAGT